mmetsp:Transcript_66522/g.105232  ORF Transcript_66522/g.105232 Transcript_66522/m.105232 type:complete len:230 (+) Transcript_66522:1208-1897(+)
MAQLSRWMVYVPVSTSGRLAMHRALKSSKKQMELQRGVLSMLTVLKCSSRNKVHGKRSTLSHRAPAQHLREAVPFSRPLRTKQQRHARPCSFSSQRTVSSSAAFSLTKLSAQLTLCRVKHLCNLQSTPLRRLSICFLCRSVSKGPAAPCSLRCLLHSPSQTKRCYSRFASLRTSFLETSISLQKVPLLLRHPTIFFQTLNPLSERVFSCQFCRRTRRRCASLDCRLSAV